MWGRWFVAMSSTKARVSSSLRMRRYIQRRKTTNCTSDVRASGHALASRNLRSWGTESRRTRKQRRKETRGKETRGKEMKTRSTFQHEENTSAVGAVEASQGGRPAW